MSTGQSGPCNVPLTQLDGSGFNTYAAPTQQGAQYKAITEQLLYEILQAIKAALPPPAGMAKVISFKIGDGNPGTPVAGTTSLHAAALQGQTIVNMQLLVIRNGIALMWGQQINRFNDGTDGGFDFTVSSGLFFDTGDTYDIYAVSQNTAIAP